jgi:hypothetical protein
VSGLVGNVLDHYRLVEQVGQGGMATVYRATDTRSMQDVAVKVLSPTIGSEKRFVRRFRREASLVSRLKHAHIVPVIGYGQAKGFVYIAMPFVAGDTLQDRIAKRRLTEAEAARWISQIASALEFAHRKGIIHRDIKPSNILIDKSGNARLTDFGLARMVEGSSTLTGSLLMGTPAYVSPEQARGDRLDARSDQYSLGVILYQIVTGRLPFDGESPMVMALKHIQEAVPLPRYDQPEILPEVEAVILKALAKDPARRFASAEALGQAFQMAQEGKLPPGVSLPSALTTHIAAAPVLPPRMRSTPSSRRPAATGFLVVITAAALLVAGAMALPALRQALGFGGQLPAPATATLSVPAPVTLPTATPGFTLTATPVESATCPGVRMTNFARQGSDVRWTLDNARAVPLRLANVLPGGPTDNPPVGIWLGGQALWVLPPGATPEADATLTLPPDLSLVEAGSTRQFLLRYTWEDVEAAYSLDLVFEDGCVLGTTW